MKKRFLSLLLTLAMVLSLFPGMAVTASAAGTDVWHIDCRVDYQSTFAKLSSLADGEALPSLDESTVEFMTESGYIFHPDFAVTWVKVTTDVNNNYAFTEVTAYETGAYYVVKFDIIGSFTLSDEHIVQAVDKGSTNAVGAVENFNKIEDGKCVIYASEVPGSDYPDDENTPAMDLSAYLTLSKNDSAYTVNGLADLKGAGWIFHYLFGNETAIDTLVNGEGGLAKVPSNNWSSTALTSLNVNTDTFTNDDAANTHVLLCATSGASTDPVFAYAVLDLAKATSGGEVPTPDPDPGPDEGGTTTPTNPPADAIGPCSLTLRMII